MGPKYEPRSKIYDLDPIEADDELDLEMSRLYADYRNVAKNKSEIELHNYLQDKASQNKKEYNEVVSALLYGALTEAENARMFFQSIASVNRDNYFVLIQKLQSILISVKFQLLRSQARDQVFWLISELTNLGAPHVDSLYMILMRQIRGGDTSQPNAILCDHILRLFELHKSWLETNPKVIPIAVYTYLRVIADHRTSQLQQLQQKEIRFVHMLMREKWMHCVPIGRDLVRVLYDLSTMPEFTQVWDDLLNNPQKLSPKFGGVQTMLKSPTPRDFLKCRLTPDIEHKLLFILQNLRINQFQKNLNWFTQRFLNTPESEPFYVDIVRYLVAGWYPSNQILQSDIVPRYVVIGSMIRTIKSNVVAANVRTALIFDWLFFKPTDNIMFIEPAMLLMERSAERYPSITANLMEFLKFSVERYFPPMKDYMAQCVASGMRVLLSKGVVRSLIPIYRCPATEAVTREYMQALFSEFLVEDSYQQAQGPPSLPSSVTMHASIPLPPPSVASVERSQSNTPRIESAELPSEQDDSDMEEGEEREVEPQSALRASKEDEDEDAYLYGDSDSNNKNESAQEDQDMENVNETHAQDPPVLTSIVDAVKNDDSRVNEAVMVDADEEQMATDDDYEDDDESTEGLQSNQSYWIFGDSLKRFKEACNAVKNAQKDTDLDEYNVQILIVKRSLKEILAVFLRLAIPAETLAITIGPSIRNMTTSNLLTHTTTEATSDDDSIVTDSSKDAFDLVMSNFWNARAVAASRDKMVRLIGCIAHNNKSKGRRHVIGMRWWAFMAAQLQAATNDNNDVWFTDILKNYETYVLHAYALEESEIDQSEYFKEYLRGDLEMLAEHNAALFNTIIPLIYQYLPDASVGNTELLKITLLVLLPDAMGRIACSLHFGNTRVFGDQIDTNFLEGSLALPAYETMSYWQLLAAEIQGKIDRIEQFFQKDQVATILKTKLKNELMPSLLSILTSIQPTKDLIYAMIQIVPEQHYIAQPQVQLILTCLQHWSTNSADTLTAALDGLIISYLDQIESDTNELEACTTLLALLVLWWHQKTTSETFKNNKSLLSKVYKLSKQVGYDCPKEWNQEFPKKKKRSILLDSDDDDEDV